MPTYDSQLHDMQMMHQVSKETPEGEEGYSKPCEEVLDRARAHNQVTSLARCTVRLILRLLCARTPGDREEFERHLEAHLPYLPEGLPHARLVGASRYLNRLRGLLARRSSQ